MRHCLCPAISLGVVTRSLRHPCLEASITLCSHCLLLWVRLLSALHYLWDCLPSLHEDMQPSILQAPRLVDLDGRKRVRSRMPALPGRPANALAVSVRLPACSPGCPEVVGRAPAEAVRPREGASEVPEGAGLPSRSCCRRAARALSRRLPCPVFVPFLHALGPLDLQCTESIIALAFDVPMSCLATPYIPVQL